MLKPFGTIDWVEFIQSFADGRVFVELIDAGMVRRHEGRYGVEEIREGVVQITAHATGARARSKTIAVPRQVMIDAALLTYFGLYDGDGNKTGDIGFAQNEPVLQNYVFDATRRLIGHFPTEVTILEDELYFEGPVVKARLAELARDPTRAAATERDLKHLLMYERYQSGEIPLDTEKVRFVISPKKGARAPGESSYEIIKYHKGSRLFLPLLLALIKEVIFQVSESSARGRKGITWIGGEPQYFSLIEYVARGGRCGCSGAKHIFVSQRVLGEEDGSFVTAFGRGRKFTVRKSVPLTPLLFVCLLYTSDAADEG